MFLFHGIRLRHCIIFESWIQSVNVCQTFCTFPGLICDPRVSGIIVSLLFVPQLSRLGVLSISMITFDALCYICILSGILWWIIFLWLTELCHCNCVLYACSPYLVSVLFYNNVIVHLKHRVVQGFSQFLGLLFETQCDSITYCVTRESPVVPATNHSLF